MLDQNYENAVAEILINIGSVKFSFHKPFTLTSGLKSPVYVDCRKIISFVKERNKILDYATKYFEEHKINFDIMAGGETAGIPYAAYLSDSLQKPMIYVRKKPKGFGNDQQIEGHYKKNQKAILIEDLATDGGSKIVFIEALRKAELLVSDVFVIFYYNIFDIKNSPLASSNINIHYLATWKNIIDVISKKNLYTNENIDNLNSYLQNPSRWRKENE